MGLSNLYNRFFFLINVLLFIFMWSVSVSCSFIQFCNYNVEFSGTGKSFLHLYVNEQTHSQFRIFWHAFLTTFFMVRAQLLITVLRLRQSFILPCQCLLYLTLKTKIMTKKGLSVCKLPWFVIPSTVLLIDQASLPSLCWVTLWIPWVFVCRQRVLSSYLNVPQHHGLIPFSLFWNEPLEIISKMVCPGYWVNSYQHNKTHGVFTHSSPSLSQVYSI